ncbi:cation:proton antiporter [Streptomyces sp. 15-116A]|uniref:cation:proton antiporter domain-containing protein n=1 Tax=Streptomyces sp. 15-116A TaxID=2259035 RepID=UPI0021B3BDD2|nr:cation:proton antiporter [Streptomyces sp. 15-116A]MCT7350675.1 cation:proton antiporter [Streptomyces sp. 15-116A]
MVAVLVLLSLLFVWSLVSERMTRWSITAPIAFAAAGALLTGGDRPAVSLDMETHTFQTCVELVLAVMLFTDATETRDYEQLGRSVGEGRLLGLALPGSVILAVLFGALLFPGTNWWLLAVAALVVMPMDLAPALKFLRDERVPLRVRAALNIEGGFNDGLISPLFVFCVANLVTSEGDSFADLVLNALMGAGYAMLAGGATGCLASWAMRWCLGTGWTAPGGLRLAHLALPFLAYAASVLIGGNGFVAAFVAGLCYARTAHGLGNDNLRLVYDVGHLMALAVWFTFGALAGEEFAHGVGLPVLAYGLLALTVARILPVVVALAGTTFSGAERAAIGWFGSRGVTSIVFAVLAYTQLEDDDAAFIGNVTCATVLLSVFLHGVTTEPVARWFEHHPRNPTVPAGPTR